MNIISKNLFTAKLLLYSKIILFEKLFIEKLKLKLNIIIKRAIHHSVPSQFKNCKKNISY